MAQPNTTEGGPGRMLWSIGALLLSVVLHVATMGVLGTVEASVPAFVPPETVEFFEIVDPVIPEPEIDPEPEPEPEIEPEPEPEPEIEPEPVPERPRRPQPQPEEEAAPAPLDEEAPPDPPPVEELTGFTLTGEGGDFAVATGNGQVRTRPIARPRPNPGRRDGVEGGTGAGGMGTSMGPRLVPVRNLSRRPAPPSQNSIARCLEQNYPLGARRQGLEGVVAVRAQINPNGNPTGLSVRSESVRGEGFGRACISCLRGRSWTPPLGPDGNPVGTRVTYTCRFSVRD